MRRPNAVVALVLGILSFVGFGCLTGIPAWIIGNTTVREIDTLGGDPTERSMAVAGKVLGMVATLLFAAGVLIFLILQVFMLSAFSSTPRTTFPEPYNEGQSQRPITSAPPSSD